NIIINFNRRFDELVNSITILAYWLHPLYKVLDKIYETAALIWNDLHYSEESCTQLLVEMQSWKRKDEPYHLSYNSTRETPIKW
ncbi:11564_t:CDS:2, partial [Dentiscutata erythropus]